MLLLAVTADGLGVIIVEQVIGELLSIGRVLELYGVIRLLIQCVADLGGVHVVIRAALAIVFVVASVVCGDLTQDFAKFFFLGLDGLGEFLLNRLDDLCALGSIGVVANKLTLENRGCDPSSPSP